MAGTNPGDVGFFNCHYRIGGAKGSKVETGCTQPQTCMAVRICAHFTSTSSAYVENSWAWGADHDLDGGSTASVPGSGGGFLIESQNGLWLLGIGIGKVSIFVSRFVLRSPSRNFIVANFSTLQNTIVCTS